jgi:hypothetical protein
MPNPSTRIHRHSTGNCWRALPLEKRVWEVKAKHAKAEHKVRHPEYRFRPVHNKNKEKKKKAAVTAEDERRCEEVAQLLLEGKKGDELAAAVRDLDRMRSNTPGSSQSPEPSPAPLSSSLLAVPSAASFYGHRRSSSVPLPNDFHPITLPSVPFLSPNGGDFLGQRFGSHPGCGGANAGHPAPSPSAPPSLCGPGPCPYRSQRCCSATTRLCQRRTPACSIPCSSLRPAWDSYLPQILLS